MQVLIELLLFFVLFIIVFTFGMSVVTSPVLALLYLDRTHRLQKLMYRIGDHESETENSIDRYHPFYLALGAAQKKEFLWRVYYFIKTTDFVIKFKTDRTKVKMTIAFAAAQISLGLTIKSFTQYGKVIVYPDDYFSQINQRYHKGEVNPGAGIIVLSWKSILYGLSKKNDGINLLIHEFAHALRLEHKMRSEEYMIFDEDNFAETERLATVELENIRTNDDHFFRKYATTNLDEFFAIASENFFERPLELNENFPNLYISLRKLYNQDTSKSETLIPKSS